MKIRDLEGWPPHWATPYGDVDWNAPVLYGTLKEMYPWAKEGHTYITLVVDCRGSKYYGVIKVESESFPKLTKVLRDSIGRPIRDVIEMDPEAA